MILRSTKSPTVKRRSRREQLSLTFPLRGGKRKKAGCKPIGSRAGVPHRARPEISRPVPLHVTLRMAPEVWNLRSARSFRRIKQVLSIASDRFGLRIVQFSVQGNHIHLLCESETKLALLQDVLMILPGA
jgi:hypothetical protein